MKKVVRKQESRSKTPKQSIEPDITILEAGVKSLSEEVINIKKDLKEQRAENKNVIIAVVIAFLFIVVTVAIEVILFHSS